MGCNSNLYFSAMENWGLVTYREVYLLIDSKVSSTRMKMNVALVVAHELAHLWFGDLVTMVCFKLFFFILLKTLIEILAEFCMTFHSANL